MAQRRKGCGWMAPLIWEKPAICWAPRDPSSLPYQLHTIEFLGTVAAMVPHLHGARSRGKAGAAVLKAHSVVGDDHHSARMRSPRGPFAGRRALRLCPPQSWPLPILTDTSPAAFLRRWARCRLRPPLASLSVTYALGSGDPAVLRTDHHQGHECTGSHAGHKAPPAGAAQGRLSTSPKTGVCGPIKIVIFGTASP